MISNARIEKTYLGLTQNNTIGIELIFKFIDDEWKEKYISTGGIELKELELITNILCVIGVNTWEELQGKMAQIEFDNEVLISMSNILNSKISISFRKQIGEVATK